jgi:hypothetical protein
VAAVALFALFFVQHRAIQGKSGFEPVPEQMAIGKLYGEEGEAGEDAAKWRKVLSGYETEMKTAGDEPAIQDGRKFAAAMVKALSMPERDLLARLSALNEALGLVGADTSAAKRRESMVKEAIRPISEAIRKDIEGQIAQAERAEERGDWGAAQESYEQIKGSPAVVGTPLASDERLSVGEEFTKAMAAVPADDPRERLAALRAALELMGNSPQMRRIRKQGIDDDIAQTVRSWVESTGRDAGKDWTLASKQYQEILSDPAVAGTPLADEVRLQEQFATAMGQAQRLLRSERYASALQAYTDAAETDGARDDERRLAQAGRQSVEIEWKKSVTARIDRARSGEGITPEEFYQKVITELADMARALGRDPEALFREVTGR